MQSGNVDAQYIGIVDGESSGVASIFVETSSGHNEIIIIPGTSFPTPGLRDVIYECSQLDIILFWIYCFLQVENLDIKQL